VVIPVLFPGVLGTLAEDRQNRSIGKECVPGQCLVLSVFLDVLALGQDSRPLYCLLSALYCNEVVACPFVPAFVT